MGHLRTDGTTVNDITTANATDVRVRMGEAFNGRFNGGAASVAALAVEFGDGSTSGITRAYITGAASGESFVYMVGVSSLPAAGVDLSMWAA